MILFLISLYYKGGHTYNDESMSTLILVEKSTSKIVVSQSVVTIESDSITSSAFYPCRNNIKSVSFESNSKLTTLGILLFSETSLQSIDFTNCASLTIISLGCFRNCKSLTSVILPPNLLTLSPGAFSLCSILPLIAFPNSLETISNYDRIH